MHPQREWRAVEQRRAGTLPHNLHALSWAIELHRVVGELATDYWRTPRYATGRYPVPQTGNGHKRHPITAAELDVPEGHAYLDLPPFREIKPDVSLELRIPSLRLTFDLLVELDLTGRPSYNHDKLRAYDAFLTGWALAHPRYRALGTRPVTRLRLPRPPQRARLRPRSRPAAHRPNRPDGHRRTRVVLRRPPAHLLRRRTRHLPRLAHEPSPFPNCRPPNARRNKTPTDSTFAPSKSCQPPSSGLRDQPPETSAVTEREFAGGTACAGRARGGTRGLKRKRPRCAQRAEIDAGPGRRGSGR